MAFAFIEEDDLTARFEDAKKYMLPVFEPLEEFERIARNKPHPGIDKSMPKVTDGTLAALIQEQPKRIIQQIPTGKIVADSRWLEIVAGYILSHEILPNSNQVAALIQKCWAVTSKTLTYGSQPAFVQFVNRGDYFGTDFTLPYIKDVLLEPGKLSDRDSNVIFLRAYYQPNQIDAIIKKETMLVKNSQDRRDAIAYESGWDLTELAKLKDMVKQKDVSNQTPQERLGRLNSKGFIEIVHCFQRGIGAQFYSFSPVTKKVVRRRKNKDPRGQIPIHYMYANVDLSNPLGRGSVEISGGMQNLLDSEVQSYQYMRALMMNPPLKVRGSVNTASLKYAPNALWKLGTDPANDVEPAMLESKSLEQFPTNYGLIKSQILNLNSSTDTSVSSTSGNPGFSKTQAGVQATEQRLGVSDNYIRRQFESWFEEVQQTEINLYFAERSGTQELKLDPMTADKLRQVEPTALDENDTIRINYDSETPNLEFKVDPTSSTIADNQEQIADLQLMIHDLSTNPYIPYQLQAEGKEIHVGVAYEQLFELYGIKNIDKIITDIENDPQTGQPKQPSVMTPFFDKPKLSVNFSDLSPKAQVQALANGGINISEEDVMVPNAEQMAGGARGQNPVPEPGQEPATDATGAALAPAPHANDLNNNPTVVAMKSLGMSYADLPPDLKRLVEQAVFGQSSTMDSPIDAAHNIKASDAAVKVAQLHHQATVAKTQADQASKSHDLAATSAKQSHQLAVKQANKPTPKPQGAK